MSNNRVLISKGRFREIVATAHEFKQRLPLATPVDPFAYVPLANARAVTFSYAREVFEYEFLPSPNPSFTVTARDSGRSMIFHAEVPRPVLNWRIAKELGHIMLGHINDANRNVMSRVTADPERNRLDVESEIFAAAFMVSAEHLVTTDPVILANLCGIPECQAGAILRFLATNSTGCAAPGSDIFFSMA